MREYDAREGVGDEICFTRQGLVIAHDGGGPPEAGARRHLSEFYPGPDRRRDRRLRCAEVGQDEVHGGAESFSDINSPGVATRERQQKRGDARRAFKFEMAAARSA